MSIFLAVRNTFWLKLFLFFGSDPNQQDSDGNTPLHHCILNKRADSLELLLNNSADPRIRNLKGHTPLHLACEHGNLPATVILIERDKEIIFFKDNCNRLAGELSITDQVKSIFNQYRVEYNLNAV